MTDMVFQAFVYAFVWFVATLLAALEVEAEGKEGWAYKTATWYRVTGPWGAIFGRMQGNKPATGYHFFLNMIVAVVAVALVVAANYETGLLRGDVWLSALARYLVFMPVWDFTWFLLNPDYAGKIDRQHVWWHATQPWVGPTPVSNTGSFVASFFVAWLAGFPSIHAVCATGVALAVCGVWTFSGRYHAWRLHMLATDERHLTVRGKM